MTHFRRNIFAALAACFLCVCGALFVWAQDVFLRPAMEVFIDKDTRLEFPALLETFQKVRVRKNEKNPVFGTVVRYENEAGTCADIYIYSLDKSAKAVRQDEFEKHFAETDQSILDMPELNAKITSVTHLEAPGRKAPENGREAHYLIQIGSTKMESVLFLALYRGKLVKVRVSYSEEDKDEAEAACRFIDAASALLNKGKTAETAAPAPVPQEKKPESAPETPNAAAGA